MIVLVFLAVSLVSLVAMGVNGDTFSMFADLLIGSVLFIACSCDKKGGKKSGGSEKFR